MAILENALNRFRGTNVPPINESHEDVVVLDDDVITTTGADGKQKLECLLFQLSIRDEYGDYTTVWKAVSLVKIIRTPFGLREQKRLKDITDEVVRGYARTGINYIVMIANILHPKAIGLLYTYGVQAIADTPEEARALVSKDYVALTKGLTGAFRGMEYRRLTEEEGRGVSKKMADMKELLIVRGIPDARESMGQKADINFGGMGGSRGIDEHEQVEEFIRAMSDREFIFMVLTSPVESMDINRWLSVVSAELSRWKSVESGSRVASAGLTIPIAMQNNIGTSQGTTNSLGHGINQSHMVGHADGTSTTWSHTHTATSSVGGGATHAVASGVSQGVGHSTGVNHGTNVGHAAGHTATVNHSHAAGTSASTSQSASHSTSASSSASQSSSASSSASVSHGNTVTHGQTISHSTGGSTTNSNGTNWSTSHGATATQSHSTSAASSHGGSSTHTSGNATSTANGTSHNWGHGGSQTHTTGTNTMKGGSNSLGANASADLKVGIPGTNGGVSVGGNYSHTWNHSTTDVNTTGNGTNWSVGHGTNHTVTNSHNTSSASGTNWNTSSGVTNGTSHAQSTTHMSGGSHTTSTGSNWSNGVANQHSSSSSSSSTTGSSVTHGTGTSTSTSASKSQSVGATQGTSSTDTVGSAQANSTTQNWGASQGTSATNSQNSGSNSSVSDSTSSNWSNSTSNSDGVSNGVNHTDSSSNSNGTSSAVAYGSSTMGTMGSSAGIGIGPFFSISKSYQWHDAEAENLANLLDTQRVRLLQAQEGQGMMFVDVYILCPDENSKQAANTAASAAFFGNKFPTPLEVIEPDEDDVEHLFMHGRAFSPCYERDTISGILDQYKWSTILLPMELTAYSAPLRLEVGGAATIVEDIPVMRVPDNRGDRPTLVGDIISGDRWHEDVGYVTPFEYRLDSSELHHTLIVGASGFGKTVAATQMVKEIYHHMKFKSKRSHDMIAPSVVALDWKKDWRILQRFTDPDKFHHYSLANYQTNPIRMNLLQVPPGVRTEEWMESFIEMFLLSFSMGGRAKSILWQHLVALYNRSEVDAFRYPENSWMVTADDLYLAVLKSKEGFEQAKRKGGKVGNEMRDAYSRLLDRLIYFHWGALKDMFCFKGDGPDDAVQIPDLCREDGHVTVIEGEGLEAETKKFVIGVIANGIYTYGLRKNGFDGAMLMVLEEAHQVLMGAGGDKASESTVLNIGESKFEIMFNEARGWNLYLMAISQSPSKMPAACLVNTAVTLTFRIDDEMDVGAVMNKLARDPRYDHRDFKRWIQRLPIGWGVVRSSRVRDFKDSEPSTISVRPLKAEAPSDDELRQWDMERTTPNFDAIEV